MKKIIMISLIAFSSLLFADTKIGVSINAPIGNNGIINIGFKSDDHRYDNRYRNFNYKRNGYFDDFGYYFGYFDRVGYFYNNIFFTYNSRYTYRDRLNHRGYFSPHKVHYRPYKYHKINNWNTKRNYRKINEPIYGPYYDKKPYQNKIRPQYNKQQNNKRYNDNKRNPSNGNKYYEKEQYKRK